MMRSFLAAVQFLTILPVRGGVPKGSPAAFFPLVGAIVGLAGAGVYWLSVSSLTVPIAALLALAALVLLTGGLHEDGLADVFDAFRASRTPERIHAILKDSRIGSHGAVALVLALALRWQALTAAQMSLFRALPAAVGASRASMVALAFVSAPAGQGLGAAFCRDLNTPAAVSAILQGLALPFLCGPAAGAGAALANTLAVFCARAYFERRIGGVTGDCLGALCQVSEILTLLVFSCRLFI